MFLNRHTNRLFPSLVRIVLGAWYTRGGRLPPTHAGQRKEWTLAALDEWTPSRNIIEWFRMSGIVQKHKEMLRFECSQSMTIKYNQ